MDAVHTFKGENKVIWMWVRLNPLVVGACREKVRRLSDRIETCGNETNVVKGRLRTWMVAKDELMDNWVSSELQKQSEWSETDLNIRLAQSVIGGLHDV